MKITTETELCKKFIEAHPRKEHLWFEVHIPGGRADIVYKENQVVGIYETKLTLSLELLEQCISRREYCHYVYAVVPKVMSKRQYFLLSLFEKFGIGVIQFREEHSGDWKNYRDVTVLHEVGKPKLNRTPKAITVYEENKSEIAGSKNAGITPFGIMIKHIKRHLEMRGRSPVDKVFECQNYYGALKQFKKNIYQWIRMGVISGIEMEDGFMVLTKDKPEPVEPLSLL